jgi:hypothetical protein
MDRLRRLENLHIPLWLIKDTCWMLEWRTLGFVMIFPTIFTALYIWKRSFGTNDFFVTLAVVFWICANSYWMCSEFFGFIEYKDLAGIPFVLGMISVAIFYIRQSKPQESGPGN